MDILIISLILIASFGFFVGVLFLISFFMPSKIKENVKIVYTKVAKTRIAGLPESSVLLS